MVLLVLGASSAQAAYYDEGHAGTESDPYIIDSLEDITALSDRVNSGTEEGGMYYQLASDISISGTASWNPIGAEPNAFTGHFDGDNYAITMNINNPAYRASLFGLIGTSSGYAVKKLYVRGTIRGKFAAGIASVIDYNTNASIEDCTFMGTLESEYQANAADSAADNHTSAGGIVEVIQSGTIRECKVHHATITANENNANVSAYAGGIAATMGGGVIESCYVNLASVLSFGTDSYAGGIVGDSNYGTVGECRFNGEVNSTGYAGGIVGRMDNGNLDVEDVNVNSNVVNASLESSDITGGSKWGAFVGHIIDSIGRITSNSADITINGAAGLSNEQLEQLASQLLSGIGMIEELGGLPGTVQISGNNINVSIPDRVDVEVGGKVSSGCSSGFGLAAMSAVILLRRKRK